jgi:hypothetical protein
MFDVARMQNLVFLMSSRETYNLGEFGYDLHGLRVRSYVVDAVVVDYE